MQRNYVIQVKQIKIDAWQVTTMCRNKPYTAITTDAELIARYKEHLQFRTRGLKLIQKQLHALVMDANTGVLSDASK